MAATTEEASYIDYETFLSPTFSAPSFANTLVLTTNDPTDTPLDLATPLSRVLFDVQEIDTHIDSLTTTSALPLLSHTQIRAESSTRILETVEAQVGALEAGYKRLENEVVRKYEVAEEVRMVAERVCGTVRLGRVVGRCLGLGRQLEGQLAGFSAENSGRKDAWRGLVPAVMTVLELRRVRIEGVGKGLERVDVVKSLWSELVEPAERTLLARAQQAVREFHMSSLLGGGQQQQIQQQQQQIRSPGGTGAGALSPGTTTTSTFAQTEETKARTTAALQVLYLLSPLPRPQPNASTYIPQLQVAALQTYLQTALTSSLASLTRALATLPTLDRTLLEISARCQNIVALEALLAASRPLVHPLLPTESSTTVTTNDTDTSTTKSPSQTQTLSPPNPPTADFLLPLLHALDTASLPSYFWRSLANTLSTRVQEILNRGGVSARTLRSNRDRVRDAVRECVARGSEIPVAAGGGGGGGGGGVGGKSAKVGNWEREAAVMVGAIVGPLGR